MAEGDDRAEAAQLTPVQRERVERALLRALRARYPGRAVTVSWDRLAAPDRAPIGRKRREEVK